MTIVDKINRLEEVIMPHLVCIDGGRSEAEEEARMLFSELRQGYKLCGATCESWYQTDTLIPAAGRCKKISRSGRSMITFDGELCHLSNDVV